MEKFSLSLILHFSYCISLYIHSTFIGMLENSFDTVSFSRLVKISMELQEPFTGPSSWKVL